MQNLAFRKVKKIVSISDITTQSLKELFPEHEQKIVEIYNGVDMEMVRAQVKVPTDICLNHPAILVIGRLDERKNPVRAVNVMELVHKRNPSAQLYFLGYGSLEDEVQQCANTKK